MSVRTTTNEVRGLKRPDVGASDRTSWVTRSMTDYDGEPVNRTDSEERHECPTCGRDDFSSERVMKIHHTKVHGESIAGFSYTCDWCGEEHTKHSRTERDRVFCSDDCFTEAKSDMFPEVRKAQRNRIELECEWCGSEFEVIKAREGRARFCSEECRDSHNSEAFAGESGPNWKRATLICEYCGDEYYCKAHRTDESRFCSPDCRYSYMSDNWVGENHHNWVPDREGVDYYGPSWQGQRRRALDRDDRECQVCGQDGDVHVHHIRPFRKFGVERHAEANRLDNLVCLCPEHHAKWEGIPLKPQ